MKYVLDAPHFIDDRLLETGTEIGDDTPYALREDFVPSRQMTPLDGDAEGALRDLGLRVDPVGATAFPNQGDPGAMGEPRHPAEKAPGQPWTPWEGGAVGPEHGPDNMGREGIPAGYDTMNSQRLQPGSHSPRAFEDEVRDERDGLADADGKKRLRSLRVEEPNQDLAPKDTEPKETSATRPKTTINKK